MYQTQESDAICLMKGKHEAWGVYLAKMSPAIIMTPPRKNAVLRFWRSDGKVDICSLTHMFVSQYDEIICVFESYDVTVFAMPDPRVMVDKYRHSPLSRLQFPLGDKSMIYDARQLNAEKYARDDVPEQEVWGLKTSALEPPVLASGTIPPNATLRFWRDAVGPPVLCTLSLDFCGPSDQTGGMLWVFENLDEGLTVFAIQDPLNS